ncbi:HNH endonuclease, partial [Escherichia coli]|nr:HNH endonuclease [Escherichia coli]
VAERTTSSDCNPSGGVSSGVKNDRSGHRPPSHAEKKFLFQAS